MGLLPSGPDRVHCLGAYQRGCKIDDILDQRQRVAKRAFVGGMAEIH